MPSLLITPLFGFLLFKCAPGISAQKLSLVTPQSIPQCGNVTINWTGGVSPYSLSISADSDQISSFSFEQSIQGTSTSNVFDWPAGTPFTITVQDNVGNSDSSETLKVQPSSNSSCLDPEEFGSGSGTSGSSTDSVGDASTFTLPTPTSQNNVPLESLSNGADKSAKKKKSGISIAIIAAIIAGVVLILVLFILLIWLKRRNDKLKMTSREKFVMTFGDERAALDAPGPDDIPDSAIPQPYQYQPRRDPNGSLRSHRTTLSLSNAESAGSSRAGSSSNLLIATNADVPPTPRLPQSLAAKKGERYLPDLSNQLRSDGPSPGPANSRLHEEDIDQLATKMVALMSSGRMNDQAWSAAVKGQKGRDDLDSEIPAFSPPHYEDIAKGQGLRSPVLERRP